MADLKGDSSCGGISKCARRLRSRPWRSSGRRTHRRSLDDSPHCFQLQVLPVCVMRATSHSARIAAVKISTRLVTIDRKASGRPSKKAGAHPLAS